MTLEYEIQTMEREVRCAYDGDRVDRAFQTIDHLHLGETYRVVWINRMSIKQREMILTSGHGVSFSVEVKPFDILDDMLVLKYSPAKMKRKFWTTCLKSLLARLVIESPLGDHFRYINKRANKMRGKEGITGLKY